MLASTGILPVLMLGTNVDNVASAATSVINSKEVFNTMLSRLRQIPTFCIVDAEGSPYMVINKQQGLAKGYAFTSMEGAILVLRDAQDRAKKEGYFPIWEPATIVTLPADVAIRLSLTKKDRVPSRGGATTLPSIVDIIPTIENREDALLIDKKTFQDQGKTPLFYVDSDELIAPPPLINGSNDESPAKPLFLRKQDLLEEWSKQHPDGRPPPRIHAIDLTFVFEAAIRGYVTKIPNDGNIVFVPDQEQVDIANKMRKDGLTMYKLDRMIV